MSKTQSIRESVEAMYRLKNRARALKESDAYGQNDLTPAEIKAEQEELEKGVTDAVIQLQVCKKVGDKVYLKGILKVGQNEIQFQLDLNNCALSTQNMILDNLTLQALNELKVYYDSWKSRWTDQINAQN